KLARRVRELAAEKLDELGEQAKSGDPDEDEEGAPTPRAALARRLTDAKRRRRVARRGGGGVEEEDEPAAGRPRAAGTGGPPRRGPAPGKRPPRPTSPSSQTPVLPTRAST